MAYASAKSMRPNTIPVIDITPLREGADPAEVAAQLHAASQSLGFIYVKGHGIPAEVIAAARAAALRFFQSPAADKASVSVSAQHRGWLQPGGAKMQDHAKVDLKESFIWGLQGPDGKSLSDHSLRGNNQWPAHIPELEQHALAYFEHAHEVARHLMRGFAAGLNLADDFFLKTCQQPLSRASFVYYPAQPEDCDEDQFGVGPHTDFGVLTVLCQDDTGGLQVQDVNGDWIHAPPIEDATSGGQFIGPRALIVGVSV